MHRETERSCMSLVKPSPRVDLTLLQELNGRRIRVDYSVTDRPHAPTPGEYMGHRRRPGREPDYGRYRDRDDRDYRDSYRDRSPRHEYERDRDRYGRDSRDWRDRRSPSPPRGGVRGYSPEYRRRRSYSGGRTVHVVPASPPQTVQIHVGEVDTVAEGETVTGSTSSSNFYSCNTRQNACPNHNRQ